MRMLRPLREWEGNVRERLTFERDAGNQSVKVRCVLHPFRARFKKKRRIGRVGAPRVRHALKFKTLSLPAQLRDQCEVRLRHSDEVVQVTIEHVRLHDSVRRVPHQFEVILVFRHIHRRPAVRRTVRMTVAISLLGGNVTATARVRDRQTAMIPLPSVKKVYGEGVSVRVLTRIAFVTVTIVDAAGNRVYAEEHETNPFEGIWRF